MNSMKESRDQLAAASSTRCIRVIPIYPLPRFRRPSPSSTPVGGGLLLSLPASLGRSNLARCWWKHCPNQCRAYEPDCKPCFDICFPVRRKSHREALSRSMIEIDAKGHVRITAKHTRLVQWSADHRDPETRWMVDPTLSARHCLKIGNFSNELASESRNVWMTFDIEAVQPVTPDHVRERLPERSSLMLTANSPGAESPSRTYPALGLSQSPIRRKLFHVPLAAYQRTDDLAIDSKSTATHEKKNGSESQQYSTTESSTVMDTPTQRSALHAQKQKRLDQNTNYASSVITPHGDNNNMETKKARLEKQQQNDLSESRTPLFAADVHTKTCYNPVAIITVCKDKNDDMGLMSKKLQSQDGIRRKRPRALWSSTEDDSSGKHKTPKYQSSQDSSDYVEKDGKGETLQRMPEERTTESSAEESQNSFTSRHTGCDGSNRANNESQDSVLSLPLGCNYSRQTGPMFSSTPCETPRELPRDGSREICFDHDANTPICQNLSSTATTTTTTTKVSLGHPTRPCKEWRLLDWEKMAKSNLRSDFTRAIVDVVLTRNREQTTTNKGQRLQLPMLFGEDTLAKSGRPAFNAG